MGELTGLLMRAWNLGLVRWGLTKGGGAARGDSIGDLPYRSINPEFSRNLKLLKWAYLDIFTADISSPITILGDEV